MQFQRQAADGTAIAAIRHLQRAAISGEQGEDPFDGIVHAGPGGRQQHGTDALAVHAQHRQQHVLLGWKGVIEAARIGLRFAQNVLDAGRAIALFQEQLHGREDQTIGGGRRAFHFNRDANTYRP